MYRLALAALALPLLSGCPGTIDDPARFGVVPDDAGAPPADDAAPRFDDDGGLAPPPPPRDDAGAPLDAGLPLPPPPPPPTTPVSYEAETDLELDGYVVDPNDGAVIRLPDGTATGSAAVTFDGEPGPYSLTLVVRAENDGTPGLSVVVNGLLLVAHTYPPGAEGMETVTLPPLPLTLAPGDRIELVGTSDAGAWARIDRVELSP